MERQSKDTGRDLALDGVVQAPALATLNNEVRDDAMELSVVVVALFAKGDEIVDSVRRHAGQQLHLKMCKGGRLGIGFDGGACTGAVRAEGTQFEKV